MQDLGRTLIALGGMLVVVGVVVLVLARLQVPLGRLPGDFKWQGRGWSVSFPLVTSIVLSIVLSLLFWIVGRMRR